MGLFGVYGANHKLYGEIKSLLQIIQDISIEKIQNHIEIWNKTKHTVDFCLEKIDA